MKRCLRFAVLFLLPVLFLFPYLHSFPFLPGASFSDLAITHFPNGLYLQRTVQQTGTIPLWSPTILSGYPFAANPLSGLFYPPGWLALLFPLPLGFNLGVVMHLVWGGIGMYLFLRREGLGEDAALLGALTFEALPKLFSHLGAGHLTLVYAVAWTPWLLFADQAFSSSAGRLRWLAPGLVFGLLILADVRWSAYAGLLWLAYSIWKTARRSPGLNGEIPGRSLLSRTGQWLAVRSANLGFAVLIAAPLLLPLVEYTRLSTRSLMTARDSFTLSMPASQLVGLFYPNFLAAAEWEVYPGALTMALVLFLLVTGPARSRAAFWLATLGLTLLLALGENIPFLRLLAFVPGFDLLRVPPRFLFVSGFCFATLAGYGLHHLGKVWFERSGRRPERSILLLFAVTTFVVLLALGAWFLVDQHLVRVQFAWGAFFLLAGTVLVMLGRGKQLPPALLAVLFAALSLVDLTGVNRLSLVFLPAGDVLETGQQPAEYLVQRGGQEPFRVYSPSYSLPQQVAAWHGIELADGIDPLQLKAYVEFMEAATGVPSRGYSVTLPPFASASPESDNRLYLPDARLLGLLNVRYVVSEFELAGSALRPAAEFGDIHVYENPLALPRAWVQPTGSPVGEGIRQVSSLSMGPNDIYIEAEGPGLLVLSEVDYPGWQVAVDGQPGQIERVAGLLRGVRIDAGMHRADFSFRPRWVFVGLGLALLAWIILILAVANRRPAHG